MKPALFKPSALSLAIAGAAVMPISVWAEGLLDDAGDIVTLRETSSNYYIRGFDIHELTYGRFAVVWAENNMNDSDKLYLQLVGEQGQALGSPKVIAEQEDDKVEAFEFPSIEVDEVGDIYVAWAVRNNASANADSCTDTNGADEIRAVSLSRPYTDTTNITLPGAFGTSPCGVELVMDHDGDFAIAWSNRNSNIDFDLSMQTYLAGGVPIRGRYQFVQGAKEPFTLAIQNNQTLLVGWIDADDFAVGQRFDLQLNKLGSDFYLDNGNVSSPFSDSFKDLGIASHIDNSFLAYWVEGGDYSDFDVKTQQWNEDGTAGLSFDLANITSASSISSGAPSLESDSEGKLLSVWDYDDPARSGEIGSYVAVEKDGTTILDSDVEFAFLSSTSFTYSPRIAINNERAATAWVEDAGGILKVKTFAAVTEVPEEEEESTELFGSFNQPWLWLLGGLMAAWRFAIRWRRPHNSA